MNIVFHRSGENLLDHSLNVRQLVIYYPLTLFLKKREEEKKNELVKRDFLFELKIKYKLSVHMYES